ncbi:MAG: 2-amino-4-hydroxy-6-hydroxymethyldihydropteridine diphosphokinase [Spirochaetales bacterium]|nr:2-amino-4-hydroxy-6-hydroxymethyldihydropteridine diphosphokinase [Spirochaetales bacterium]
MVKIEDERKLHTAYIGVGSNIGDRYSNIKNAEFEINSSGNSKVVEVSKIYETEPMGYLDQDYFLNCVFKIFTSHTPVELLKLLLNTEKILKRKRIIHWGPRTIDLDILFFDNFVISSTDLIIPHPRLHERMFVIKPICDLASDFIHPVEKKSCLEIAEKLEKSQSIPVEWFPS